MLPFDDIMIIYLNILDLLRCPPKKKHSIATYFNSQKQSLLGLDCVSPGACFNKETDLHKTNTPPRTHTHTHAVTMTVCKQELRRATRADNTHLLNISHVHTADQMVVYLL